MTARKRRRQKRSHVPLNLQATGDLRQKLTARLVCSEPWAVEIIRAIDEGRVDVFVDDKGDLRADFSKVENQLRRAGAYPPNGLMTLMHRCPRCGHWTPPGYAERGTEDQCEECTVVHAPDWLWTQWPASPSADSIRRAKLYGLKPRRRRIRMGRLPKK